MPVVFRVKLGKTGNSLRITVPSPIIEGFGWKKGDQIVLFVTDQEITIRKMKSETRRTESADGPAAAGDGTRRSAPRT